MKYRFWESVGRAASREATASPLPGYNDGPADAFRHIIGVAELRRRFGYGVAYVIATGNEVWGTHARSRSLASREMDDHNNAIGLAIGAKARTYEEVVRLAQAAMDAGIARGGNGENGTPRWKLQWSEPARRPAAQRSLPVQWPDDIPSSRDDRFGAEQFGIHRAEAAMTPRQREAATLARLRDLPTSEWSEPDVRAVINARPYLDASAPEHDAWRARVRQSFEERTRTMDDADAASSGDAACGGVAAVRAYTREGPSGPVHVRAHDRAVACD